MSYDIGVMVKVDGCDKYIEYSRPEYASPTYNLYDMFVACMDWHFDHSIYPASFALEKLQKGKLELTTRREYYKRYNPPNGWGDIDCAIRAIDSAITRIYECAEEIPIECLYFEWMRS